MTPLSRLLVPSPQRSARSRTRLSRPWLASSRAIAQPTTPAPMTTTEACGLPKLHPLQSPQVEANSTTPANVGKASR